MMFQGIILKLGAFHTICNALGIIGKRFQDAGLKDLCIESGILAEGSINGVMEGKMYNCAICVHKCIYEHGNDAINMKKFCTLVDNSYSENSHLLE